jgi:hypothetical protein
MKVTIKIDGNGIDDLFDVFQELADNAYGGVYPENCEFEGWIFGKPEIEVEYDAEEEEV